MLTQTQGFLLLETFSLLSPFNASLLRLVGGFFIMYFEPDSLKLLLVFVRINEELLADELLADVEEYIDTFLTASRDLGGGYTPGVGFSFITERRFCTGDKRISV